MDLLQIDSFSFYRSVYFPVESNMYILTEGNEAIAVDTNICPELFILFKENNIKKVHLLLTHEHYDHSLGISWLKEHFDVTLYCHILCSEGLSTKKRSIPRLVALVVADKDKRDGTNNLKKFKEDFVEYSHTADYSFDKEEIIKIVGHSILCIHTPGHSPGSSIYVLDEKVAFTGDSLIMSNKVITSFRGGSKDEFYNITLPILKGLLDDMTIMPGHGVSFRKKEFNFNIYNV